MSHEMNHDDEVRELMAEYLGGELDEAGRAKFEAMLAGDERHAAEVSALRATQDALHSLADHETSPAALTRVKPSTPGFSFRGHALRYAAVIALAFLGGYIVRGLEPVPGMVAVDLPTQTDTPTAGGSVEESGGDSGGDSGGGSGGGGDFERRLTREYLNAPDRSGLSRSLIAYARATRSHPK